MIALLLALMVLQVNPGPTGIASGVVSSANGTPAAGIRVFAIPAGTSDSVTVNATVFEGLTQTDASGRYRLAIPPGRYYIGVGAVASPTYYPSTTNISSARAIVVSADRALDNINFSQYVTPGPGNLAGLIVSVAPPLPPGSTGVVSGIIRAADGTPAAGIPVVLIASSTLAGAIAGTGPRPQVRFLAPGTSTLTLSSISAIVISTQATPVTTQPTPIATGTYTDNNGRYRFENVSPNTYNIVAGYSDSPRLYPGTSDVATAQSITTTPTTMMDSLDFTLSSPSPSTSVLKGKVLGIGSRPAGGAVLTLTRSNISGAGIVGGILLPSQVNREIRNEGNGTYRFDGIGPGSYNIRVELPGISTQTRPVQVSGETELDFDFQINTIVGKFRWDDGSPFDEPAIRQVAVSTVSNPNVVMTDIIPVARDGVFSKAISAGEYRFYTRNLPTGEAVKSVTVDGMDITNTSFEYNGRDPINIEVLLTRKIESGTKVSGTIVDAATGKASAADRVLLCCLKSGPFERISAPLQRDGTFEFLQVPEGEYKVELLSTPTLTVAGAPVEVGKSETNNLKFVSTSSVTASLIQITVDGGTVPSSSRIKVTWTTVNSGIPITTYGSPDGMLWSLPAGVQFELAVSDIPPDLKFKSITSGGRPLPASSPAQRIVTSPTNIVIVLEPKIP